MDQTVASRPNSDTSLVAGQGVGKFGLWPILLLLVFAALIFAEHYYTRVEPLSRDEATYAVAANEMRHGRSLYVGVFDQKPPAVYLTYLVAEALTGYNRGTIFGLALFAAWATLIGVYFAGKALAGRPAFGLWAAGFWTLLCCDLTLQANQPNTEVFMNAALIWAFVLLTRSRQSVMGVAAAAGTGLLLAWATLYKPVTIADAGCLLGIYVLLPPGGAPHRRLALGRAVIAAGVIGAVWAGIVLFFAAEGHLHAFYDAMVVYNRAYAGSLQANLREALHPGMIVPRFLRFCLPFALLAVAGLVAGLRSSRASQWLLLVAYAFGTFVSISLPGRFYPHYYQLWIPLIAIGPAWALAALAETRLASKKWVVPALGGLATILLLRHELPFYRLTPDQWTERKYAREYFAPAVQVAHEINTLLRPGESFYDASVEPELYLETERRPPTGIFYSEPTTGGPFIQPFTQRVLGDLARTRPELIIRRNGIPINPAIFAWIQVHYRPMPGSQKYPPFEFWMRRGGQLEARRITNDALTQK